ncbi:NepR family anti-sigma factor [Pontivivens insulae]|uniref:Anti-sigma factor NepR domain-containing protein n=1 Tax=Pontivivens insulae TaxID=1639689 RepID=A0A2R8A8X4_9RHOB|nr:hypothetical protein [Pontivivens insulae]RED18580.1 hypothetical protein DFR53_0778 [Pontivivens insulae]SPF28478.1 hypothetical protein POI8812_00779 [Pontivivens insulae]
MSKEKQGAAENAETRIESHLKRVFEDDMQAPMSDKLAALVEQLRAKGKASDE